MSQFWGFNEFFFPLKVGWSEDRYNHIVGKLKHFLKQAGFKVGWLLAQAVDNLTIQLY